MNSTAEQLNDRMLQKAEIATAANEGRTLSISELETFWSLSKIIEDEAKADRLSAEKLLIAALGSLPDTGTTKTERLKITTGLARSYDQAMLRQVADDVPPALWPFETTFKEVRDGVRFIEQNEPDVWAKIRPALTIKPKKPAFALLPVKKES